MAIISGINKRFILLSSLLAASALAALLLTQCSKHGQAAIFVQEPLPYAQDALAPVISAKTMSFHYGKHYAGYVKKANALTQGPAYEGKTAVDVIRETAGDAAKAAVFNNAAQAWNHAFYFKCMKPQGGGVPQGRLAKMIDAAFGSFSNFKDVFVSAAKDQFGSGWVWLVLDGNKLAVIATSNADTPLAHGLTPLFTVDVWEHAYYLDYQNRRADYVRQVLDKLANWQFVSEQLTKAEPASPSKSKQS
jgi:superoxide dismutase, Fe-Mn family